MVRKILVAIDGREYHELLDSGAESVPLEMPVTKLLAHGRAGERILEHLQNRRHEARTHVASVAGWTAPRHKPVLPV